MQQGVSIRKIARKGEKVWVYEQVFKNNQKLSKLIKNFQKI